MDTLHFERYEYKYLIPEPLCDRVRHFIRPYVRPDRNAVGREGGRYTIRNVYLDTPGLSFLRAALDDAGDRMKLRIRWYDDEAAGPFFLEVKRKVRQVIIKDRVRISREQLDAYLRGDPVDVVGEAEGDRLASFCDRATRSGARPVIFCRYTREPYESVFGEYARLTFDRGVCFQDARNGQLPEDPRAWKYVDGSWATRGLRCATILELKFTNEYPRWMSDLTAEFGLQRIGYSKYACSMLNRADTAHGGMDFHRRAMVGG